jgi:PilZ domain
MKRVAREPGARGADSRRSARCDVRLTATLREAGATRYPVDLLDLSVTGFRFETSALIHNGTRVWLTIPGMEGLEAIIAWHGGANYGATFDRALHPAVLDHIVARCSVVRA